MQMRRREFLKTTAAGIAAAGACTMSGAAADEVAYEVQLDTPRTGFDGEMCWVHARGGAIPDGGADGAPAVVVTMQKLLLSGSDVFYGLHVMRTDDLGETWTGPEPQESFTRWTEDDGVEAIVCDFTPKWHAATSVLLGTGHIARYAGNRIMHVRPNQPSYSVYRAGARSWGPARTVRLPDERKFLTAGSGSGQRQDMEDGTVLLPIYFRPDPEVAHYEATVALCSFDGSTLTYVEHGSELSAPDPRGMCEPSLASVGGRHYLTLRNDVRGYVAVSDDGLRYEEPVPWRFDDGQELGSYNTQTHWVTHDDALFLTYTRRGADNDHVFRHRAPLFMARVDSERLCVLRATERIIIPERGARLGNYGVCEVRESETWVVNSEWMQPVGCEEHGSDNTLWVARVKWG